MKMQLNYLTSKKWEEVGCQELPSTPYEKEIDPRGGFLVYRELSAILDAQLLPTFLKPNS
jgi:hypothetical protein